jgi:diguanylate cyclase (GGDEF)-like protein/putative nucleotidyltransferase with HDIG domain
MPLAARAYVAFITIAGVLIVADSIHPWRIDQVVRNACYLMPLLVACGLRYRVRRGAGLMSGSYVVLLLSILDVDRSETILLGCVAVLAESLLERRLRKKPAELFFDFAGVAIGIDVAYSVYHSGVARALDNSMLIAILLASFTFFTLSSAAPAIFRSLADGGSLIAPWRKGHLHALPYHLIGASSVWLMSRVTRYETWQAIVVVLVIAYLVYRIYRRHPALLDRMRGQPAGEHVDLYLRAIETLALVIEARDHAAHQHLRRVQSYALEIGRELNLPESELQALRAAAVLHDIGKLAVPEYILSKPGKLTAEEFEKVKIHPVAGAEILSLMKFPYPVVPTVLSHHERWDGAGYPYGLRGDEIPVGARILAVVDCFDALVSDRSYRRAVPVKQAMEQIQLEAGTAYDPRVVEVLGRRHLELERMIREGAREQNGFWTWLRIECGAPATGLEWAAGENSLDRDPASLQFLDWISAASREVQALREMTSHLGDSLSLSQNLAAAAAGLRQLVPHDTMVVYVRSGRRLTPAYQNGEHGRLFGASDFAVGEGLSGWVAEHQKPICNGNPCLEPAYVKDPNSFRTLRAALVVPLPGSSGGVAGVLALYSVRKDAFSRDSMRILLGITSKLGYVIENSQKYESAQNSAGTDFLTALPNARSLSVHLAQELARASRNRSALAVVVCDLDGFKDVNDRFGHLEGDRVLKTVAAALRQSCRPYDYVARLGGDEFVVVLPETGRETATSKLAEFRHNVASAARQDSRETGLSLSAGVAVFPADGEIAEALLAEADSRMYEDKRRRKEMAVCADQTSGSLLPLVNVTAGTQAPIESAQRV